MAYDSAPSMSDIPDAQARAPFQPTPRHHSGVGGILRSLRNRNFRLFFMGQSVSMIGNFMTKTAIMWLVFRLSGESALMLGVIGFASQIPMFLLAPFGGVWVDRLDRRKLLIVTQSLAMTESLALAALTFTGLINIPLLITLAVFQGLVNALDLPARQAFVVDMVENRDDLANAIALNSTLVQLAKLIGPAIAGLLIWRIGEGTCFLIDGLSYIGVIGAYCIMTTQQGGRRRRSTSVLDELKEGLRYAWNSLPIRTLLTLLAVFGLTGFPALMSLLPIFGDALGGQREGALTYGILVGASGAGAMVGALWLASRRTVRGLVRVASFTTTGFGMALLAFAFSRILWLSIPLVMFCGAGLIVTAAAINTVLQTLAEDDKRGRVMSLYMVSMAGMVPWGSLIAGMLAAALTRAVPGWGSVSGAAATLGLMAIIVIAAGIWFTLKLPMLRKVIRPIYIQKGILPEVAVGLRGAVTITGGGRTGT
jgi:MFS family permease